MPMELALNVSPLTAVASFAAVSGLFILPTYPTLVAAVQMDDTGTTRIGKFVFNHPFFIRAPRASFWLSASASCWAALCCKCFTRGAYHAPHSPPFD